MTERTNYPPIAIFHIPECPTLGGNGTALPTDLAREGYPYFRPDSCFLLAAVSIAPYVVVEPGDDTDHSYVASDECPEDAIRALCRVCKGTHGVDGERERIEVRSN